MTSDSQPLSDTACSASDALLHSRGQPEPTTYDSHDDGCFPEVTALEDAIENSEDCIALVDLHGQFVYMNFPGMWQMEIEGQTSKIEWSQLWPQECADLAEYSIESVRCGRRTRFTAHRRTARGSTKWWDVAVSPVFDKRGEPQQMFCVLRDITDLKKVESSLRDSLAAVELLLLEVNHQVHGKLNLDRVKPGAHFRCVPPRESGATAEPSS